MNELSWYISVSHCVSDLKVFQNHFPTRRITGNTQEVGGWGSCVCSFHKNKWFSARRLLISHEHEKNLCLSITQNGREDFVGAMFRSTGGVQYEMLHCSAQALPWPKRPRNILQIDRKGGTHSNHLLHSPYFFFPLGPMMSRCIMLLELMMYINYTV